MNPFPLKLREVLHSTPYPVRALKATSRSWSWAFVLSVRSTTTTSPGEPRNKEVRVRAHGSTLGCLEAPTSDLLSGITAPLRHRRRSGDPTIFSPLEGGAPRAPGRFVGSATRVVVDVRPRS